jgi:hypothetical protein
VPEPEQPLRPDPNPLLMQAAEEEQWFADILDLPNKEQPPLPPPKKDKRKPGRYKIVPRDWNRDSWPLVHVAKSAPPIELDLPDQWPVAQVPVAKPKFVQPVFEPVEYLAYRSLPDAWTIAVLPEPAPLPPPPPPKVVFSSAEPTPPPPKMIKASPERRRFTWESPEMYHED